MEEQPSESAIPPSSHSSVPNLNPSPQTISQVGLPLETSLEYPATQPIVICIGELM